MKKMMNFCDYGKPITNIANAIKLFYYEVNVPMHTFEKNIICKF